MKECEGFFLLTRKEFEQKQKEAEIYKIEFKNQGQRTFTSSKVYKKGAMCFASDGKFYISTCETSLRPTSFNGGHWKVVIVKDD